MQKEKIFWWYICLSILRSLSDLIYTANAHKMNLILSYISPLDWKDSQTYLLFLLLSSVLL